MSSIFSVTLTESVPAANMNAGDIVVMELSSSPQSGVVVVAHLVEENKTVIRLYILTQDQIALYPLNSLAAETIIVRPDEVEFQAVVIAVIRSLS